MRQSIQIHPFLWDLNVPLYATKGRRVQMREDGVLKAYLFNEDITECQIRHYLSDSMRPVEGIEGLFICIDKRKEEIAEVVHAYYYEPKGVLISADLWDAGYNLDFILTPLKEKPVFVSEHGYKKCLPNIPHLYKTNPNTSSGLLPIDVPDWIVDFADLFTNLHWFNRNEQGYYCVTAEEAHSNFTKFRKQNIIFNEVGNDGSRIADYGRLLHFLISNLQDYLTPEGKELLGPLIESAPSEEVIENIVSRETRIQDILKNV